MRQRLQDTDCASIDGLLAGADVALARDYPGELTLQQPVHTVYVAAPFFHPHLAQEWGEQALGTVADQGGMRALAAEVLGDIAGLDTNLVAARVLEKLRNRPIEDLRIDFEDGYGAPADAVEDEDAVRAASLLAGAIRDGLAPDSFGIRMKSLEAGTRQRGLRTLDLFLGTLLEYGELPDGLIFTLPKVSIASQVDAMTLACEALERVHGLSAGALRFEVQVETPQVLLGSDGRVPISAAIAKNRERVTALHYGTYDYSAALGIVAQYQSMEHPAADFAKQMMQLAVAGTGVQLSDGSTNVVPVGDREHTLAAWKLHARLVRRSLERAFYQGWDLHPAQLPTRYLATFGFFRTGLAEVGERVRSYVDQSGGRFMDEPATIRALAGFLCRGLQCGAVPEEEILALTGLNREQLIEFAIPGPLYPTDIYPAKDHR